MRKLAYSLYLVGAILVVAPCSMADFEDHDADESFARNRKRPAFFNRPAKDNPTEQLEYAKTLLERGRLRKARRQFTALVREWHESEEAPKAQLKAAQVLEERRRHSRAFKEYQYLIDFFPGEYPFGDVLERQFAIANHVRTVRHGRVLFLPGFQSPERALPLFEQIMRNAPFWNRAFEVAMHKGLIHEHTRDYEQAIAVYRKAETLKPQNTAVADAAFRRVMCIHRLAEINPRNEAALKNSLSAKAAFLREYPDHSDAEKIRELLEQTTNALASMYFQQAEFYERKAGRPGSALIAYRDFIRSFPASELTEEAERRIIILKEKVGEE